jgi:ornithine carbamoyltransferase
MKTKRDLLSIRDLSAKEVRSLLEDAKRYKDMRTKGVFSDELRGKIVSLIFEKPSTRTRVSFEVGIRELGGNPLFLSSQELQLARGETIADTALTLSRYVHCIVARVKSHDSLLELAKHSSVPVVNALSPLEHPCQTLADLLTIMECKGKLEGIKVAWVGDGNNVCNSLLIGCTLVGTCVNVACPEGYEPPEEIVHQARTNALESGCTVEISNTPEQAVEGADVVYTDVFISMGMESEREQRLKDFKGFQITSELMTHAKKDAIFLHCLPAHRGEEVAAEVIDGPQSVVFDQAENRLHVQKAVLRFLLAE